MPAPRLNNDAATPELFEQQATACLLAAAQHRHRLLAVATQLTGCPEEGMDLFQQTCLNCHDAIQKRGFTGERYEFYLLTALKHLHVRRQQAHRRTVRTDFQRWGAQADAQGAEDDTPNRAPLEMLLVTQAVPPDAYAQLAEQVSQEARQRFSLADRVALVLQAQGYSCQQIADLMGQRDQSWVWRRLERMKVSLRQTFRQAWLHLGDESPGSLLPLLLALVCLS